MSGCRGDDGSHSPPEGFDASCVFSPVPVSLAAPAPPALESRHASVPLFPAHSARSAPRGGDRLAPADAARRYDPAGSRRDLRVPAAWLAGAEQDLPYRPRGAGSVRGDRAVDAHGPVGGPLARERAL